MSKKPKKFPKTILARTRDCEAHIKFLSEAIKNSEKDAIYYKQVSAELRVLVADKKPKNCLLLTLMDDLDARLSLHPPTNVRPGYTPKWSIVNNKGEVEDWEGNIPFRKYCESGYKRSVLGKNYTIAEFIRTVSQQEGSSHDASHIDEKLAFSHQLQILGLPSHVYSLLKLAKQIELVAIDFLRFIIKNRNYKPIYEW
jgi:hypothetical protein